MDLGYILVSLTEENFPVVSFSNEGLTPVEKLWCRAGTRNIKPVQFDAFMEAMSKVGIYWLMVNHPMK